MLVQALPVPSIEAWLKAHPTSRTMANESVVVSRLYGELKAKPDWLKDKLDSYRDSSDSALVAYLYYADLAPTQLKRLLLKALLDESLEDSEVEAMVRKYEDFITIDVNFDTLKASPARISLIRRVLNAQDKGGFGK